MLYEVITTWRRFQRLILEEGIPSSRAIWSMIELVSREEEKNRFIADSRITSYNVCYTKLLRTSCAQETPLTNSPPVLTPVGDYTIPKGTAFVLEGIATDPDVNDVLSYTWEQIDDGVVTTVTFGPTNPSRNNFV